MLKNVDDMTVDELFDAKDSMEHYFNACRECEQGINSKETVRYNRILARLEDAGETVTRWK